MRNVIVILAIIIFRCSFAQQPPGSDIYLLDINAVKKKSLTFRNPVNITNRPGYDNQPGFHPDLPYVYYASANEQGRTEIMQYDYQRNVTRQLTETPEREYSPTVTPDKKFFSCIIQRDNNAQDFGKYPVNGGQAEVIIDNLIVGYHAWFDENNILLFVLGQPNTLRWYSSVDKHDKILRENIGRSLHKIPGENAVSFVEKGKGEWTIKKVKANGSIEIIAPTLPGREDLTWTPDGKILMSDGEQLFYWLPGKSKSWEPLMWPEGFRPKGITRLAVNASGTKLALVVSE
jgi:hypothetical protein